MNHMRNELDSGLLRRMQGLLRHLHSFPRVHVAVSCAMIILIGLQFSRWGLGEAIEFRQTHPDKFGMDSCKINDGTVLEFLYFQRHSSYGLAATGISMCLISKPKIAIAITLVGLIGLRAIALSSRLC